MVLYSNCNIDFTFFKSQHTTGTFNFLQSKAFKKMLLIYNIWKIHFNCKKAKEKKKRVFSTHLLQLMTLKLKRKHFNITFETSLPHWGHLKPRITCHDSSNHWSTVFTGWLDKKLRRTVQRSVRILLQRCRGNPKSLKNNFPWIFWCVICYTQIWHHISLAKENTSHTGTGYNNWTALDVQ